MCPSQNFHCLRSIWLAFLLATVAILSLTGGTASALASLTTAPAAVLQASAAAMKQLKSVHFTLLDSATMTTATASGTPPIVRGTTNSNGDEVLSSPISFHVSTTVNLASTTASSKKSSVSVVVKGGQTYVQNDKGVWYVLSGIATKYVYFSVPSYTNVLATVLPFLQNATLTDHGIEKLNGQNLHHITLTLGENALNAFAKLEQASSQGNTQAAQGSGILDVWIDGATSYIHHMMLTSNTSFASPNLVKPQGTLSSIQGTHPIIKAARNLTVDFSQFSQIISIPTPPNAIPTTNPSVLLPKT
ncbi:MAG TPA: LppX_LprAFG lipoprotein [Ktedonobacteraceae bacterium]